MDAIVYGKLDGIEVALNTLIDSITSYNPSVAAATDLLAADDELDHAVKQCMSVVSSAKAALCPNLNAVVTHQSNNARIQHLRATLATINQSITDNLRLLADTRKDILATPATVFPDSQRNVPYDDLLEYANRISRYTVPPTLRLPPPTAPVPTSAPSQPPIIQTVNGAATEPSVLSVPIEAPSTVRDQGEGIGVASLEQSEVQWLDPLTQIPFVPWPSEEVIRQGALAQVQVMLEHGLDPSNVDTGEVEGIKHEAAEDTVMEESHGGPSAWTNSNTSRPLANGVLKSQEEEKPKVFGGLDLYDPESEA